MKFCSGNSVVVLVTEQDFAFIIKDLDACSGVLVFLHGIGRKTCFSQIVRTAQQVQRKNSLGGYIPFFLRNRTTILYIFLINNNNKH